jgi:predicted nucleic-acid-binding protein
MQDDAAQALQAGRLIESFSLASPGFVSLVTIAELAWVLSSVYRLQRLQIAQALEVILGAESILVEQAAMVSKALELYQLQNVDLGDCLIQQSGLAAGCSRTLTFDRGAARGCGMTLLG